MLLLALLVSTLASGPGIQLMSRFVPGVLLDIIGFTQLKYFVFFVFGTWVRQHFERFKQLTDNGIVMSVVISAFAISNLFAADLIPDTMSWLKKPLFLVDGVLGIVIVFTFFRKHEHTFTKEHRIGVILQYIGRRTLDVYLLHYFFLPRNLPMVGDFFLTYPNPVLEFCLSMLLSMIVIAVCLLVSKIIRLSPLLEYRLFGTKPS